MRGVLVSVEGLDGAGKSTVIGALRRRFPEAELIREPGGTRLGELMRAALKGEPLISGDVRVSPVAERGLQRAAAEASGSELAEWMGEILRGQTHRTGLLESPLSPLDELRLFNIARAELIAEKLSPLLGAGRLVITDRFTDSTIAYQGYGRGLGAEMVRGECLEASSGLTPDLTILLRIEPETRLERLDGRGARDRIEASSDEFYERVARGFDQMAEEEPERITVIDGELPARDVAERAAAALERLIERG